MLHRCVRLVFAAVGLSALALTVASCGSKSTGASSGRTIAYSHVLHLSHVISPSIPLWPRDPHVRFKVVATMKNACYYLRSFTIGEHSATHMNAPNSFIAGNPDAITSYSADQRVLPAVVIDIRSQASKNPDYQLTKQDVL